MRIVWKDSDTKRNSATFKESHYRGYTISGSETGEGWVTDMPGDDNIYRVCDHALNAIDAELGGAGRHGVAEYRKNFGIKVIGKKEPI